ncbi:DUF2281 domain-containing protein [Desulfovibrio aerotolerans]|uniref:DUF2281 domain-containing protein n=1 Tax=Solidesulfovibrio aerotolerans TaxID=295255 RepID=A0A7C9ME70_9BACT|nr:DUF2281 domain-containing protein [Solidesulfovibrio aerotolerans]MYL82370.1 DUF2281 domain-containing protein [Solidesulfovibrio aerotolerans]
MNIETVLADLVALPPQAQEEAADFIAFLRARHAAPGPAGPDAAADAAAFCGLWRDRADMADAAAWVTALRRQEWTR